MSAEGASTSTVKPAPMEKNTKQEKQKAETVPFYKLFVFADTNDKILMAIGSICAVGNGICIPLMTIFLGELVDAFGQNQNTSHVVHAVSQASLKFVYLAIGVTIAAALQVICWMATGERQAARIRKLYLKAIIRQDVAFFDKETNTGEVVGRMSGDTVLIQAAMGEKVGKFIQLTSTFVGGFVIGFIKGWLLTLVMICSIPLIGIAGGVLAIMISKTSARGQASYAKASIVVEQTIGSIRTVVSFTGEKQAVADYKRAIVNAYKSSVHQGLASGTGLGTLFLVIFGCYALAIWFGAKMIIEKGYSGGDVLNVIFAAVTGSLSMGEVSPCLSAFAAGQAAAYKMFETIKRKPEIDASDLSGKVLDDIHGDIELRDIHFSYPARPDEQIFCGFSLSASSGTTVALVGQSGSGKSTVVSLIERFYDPQAGQILIDGVNLKELQLKWIRSKIGLVSQEPVLFASTIRENIAYGKDGATTEEIRAAAELANAAKFIDKLSQGLDTLVGEHGTQLSGGQKQRVAIARAILKDPRILLLDEATSALDAESERIVQEALDRVMVNRTTIVVAHRLSTIRNADMIAVIHQGRVVEKGTHSDLIKDPEGAYSQLIQLQGMNFAETSRSFNQRQTSSLRSSSRGSSGRGGSSQRSLSFISGVGLDVPENMLSTSQRFDDPDLLSSSKTEAPKVSIRRLASLNKPEIPSLLLGALFAIINGCVFPAFAILLSSAIKMFFEPPQQLKKDSKFWALMFAAIGIVSAVAYPVQIYFFSVAGGKLIQRIRSMCFEKALSMEIGWFDEPENSSGAIGARLSSDAAAVRGLVGDALALLVQNAATAIAGLVIAFTANWQLALIVLVLIPLIGINGFFQLKFAKGFSADAKKKYEDASQVANDAVGSIRTVASFCAEQKVMELYEKKCEGPMKAGVRLGFVSGIGFGVSNALLFLVYALSFYAGALLVKQGKTTFAEVFRVFFALTFAAFGISQSSSLTPDSVKAKGAAASIFAILDRKSNIDASDDSGMTLEEVKGEIELKHVSFTYVTRPDIQIFSDINLTVPAGKTVAFVGESGCGKSTIISLLQRFYDPDSGHVTLDGHEIRKLKLKWLRQQMGLVSQEPVLFNDTIRANVAYGKGGNATESEIIAAAELANANGFISALQQTVAVVGESGCGKSTIISLLQRFYDPDSGHVTLGGHEIRKLKLKWLRQQMGLVSQEPVLFNDTICANVAYGKGGNATESEIIAAAELANANGFISALEQGYDTMVGERGIQLSGGQKQRVAIARAIVKSPKILLLDEATSALDAESERVVQDALDRVMVNRTTIVVAHRLSTIKGADMIAVVKNGVIAEKGKHESLLRIKDGAYASLVALHTTISS